jgi:hypothetical protein
MRIFLWENTEKKSGNIFKLSLAKILEIFLIIFHVVVYRILFHQLSTYIVKKYGINMLKNIIRYEGKKMSTVLRYLSSNCAKKYNEY